MSPPAHVVDAQVHLTLELDEPALLAAMDALGIAGAVLDEFWFVSDDFHGMPSVPLPYGGFRPLSPYALAASLRRPDRFSYLQRVDRRDPDLGAVLRLLGSTPACRAVRVLLHGGEERSAFGDGGYDHLLGLAQAEQLPVCVLGADVATLPGVAARFPDLPIVLDHCGWARSAAHWEQILTASTLPTVYLKWCHAARAFRHAEDPQAAARHELRRALDAFGAERVMWAGDVTEEHSGATWGQLLCDVTENPALSAGDKEWLLSRTARTLLRWPAPDVTAALTTA